LGRCAGSFLSIGDTRALVSSGNSITTSFEGFILFEGFLDTHDVAKLLLNIDYFIHQLGVSTINGPPFGISNHFAEFAKPGG
jgi:hypothetical protein